MTDTHLALLGITMVKTGHLGQSLEKTVQLNGLGDKKLETGTVP